MNKYVVKVVLFTVMFIIMIVVTNMSFYHIVCVELCFVIIIIKIEFFIIIINLII